MGTAAFWTGIIIFVFVVWAVARNRPTWPGFTWFQGVISPTTGDSAHSLYKLLVLAVAFVVAIFAVGAIEMGVTTELEKFGDFVGGIASPILTFFTFFGLLITIVLQQHTNTQARKEAVAAEKAFQDQLASQKRESFESTFFQMLTLHNTIVNSMDIRRFTRTDGTTPGDIKGRDCFKFFSEELKRIYDLLYNYGEVKRIQMAYDAFWVDWKQDLGHYFRYLYNVVRFIDDSNVGHNRYMKLLRAQLSDYELVMLFYNCLTTKGEKFKHYVEGYSLLDNLPTELLFDTDHEGLFAASARSDSLSKMAAGDTLSSTATISQPEKK